MFIAILRSRATGRVQYAGPYPSQDEAMRAPVPAGWVRLVEQVICRA